MFGDGMDKSSAQTWIVGDSDSVTRTEPQSEIYVGRNYLFLSISLLYIPQLGPPVALIADFVIFVAKSFLPT
jgi:hypothetical protein